MRAAAATVGRRAMPRAATPFPLQSCSAGGGRPPLTLLMAMRAGDGVAAVSDRKESLPGSAGREVTKCILDAGGRFYLSLSGDGRAARPILDGIGAAGPAGPAWISDLVGAMRGKYHSGMSVDGILVAAGAQGPEVHDICIRGGRTYFYENDNATSVHGDYAAHVLCRHLARGLDARSLSRGAAAARLHVLASSVAETVDSVGRGGGATSTALTWQRSGRRPATRPCSGARPTRSAR